MQANNAKLTLQAKVQEAMREIERGCVEFIGKEYI